MSRGIQRPLRSRRRVFCALDSRSINQGGRGAEPRTSATSRQTPPPTLGRIAAPTAAKVIAPRLTGGSCIICNTCVEMVGRHV